MNLLTINCQKGWIDSHREALFRYLSKELHSKKYGFIYLQEANSLVLKNVRQILRGSGYQLLTAENPLIKGETMQIAILFRDDHKLEMTDQISFANRDKRLVRPEFGALAGLFKNASGVKVISGAFHFHASFHMRLRKEEARATKNFFQALCEEWGPAASVFFGGDANSGLPWEPKTISSVFAPEFVNVTDFKHPTVSSDRLEPSVRLNRNALKLAKLGIKFRLKTDHVFVNKEVADDSVVSSSPVNIIVSDHYPVEVVLSRK